MSWTTPADLRGQVQRLWDKGLLLASLVEGDALFPRRMTLKTPSSSELADQFEQVRSWITELRQATHCRLVLRELRHRTLGTNRLPDDIWIDNIDDALALIGKSREAKRFGAIVALTRERQITLLPWLAKNPLKALGLTEYWPAFLDIVHWMQIHPRPGIYLRQIDIPGVHTKFIEAHRAVLAELLDLVCRGFLDLSGSVAHELSAFLSRAGSGGGRSPEPLPARDGTPGGRFRRPVLRPR